MPFRARGTCNDIGSVALPTNVMAGILALRNLVYHEPLGASAIHKRLSFGAQRKPLSDNVLMNAFFGAAGKESLPARSVLICFVRNWQGCMPNAWQGKYCKWSDGQDNRYSQANV